MLRLKNIAHIGFEIELLLKGINSLFEVIGGLALIYFNPVRIKSIIAFLTHDKLLKNPTDFIANALVHFSHSFSTGTHSFMVMYFISHGVIKAVLVFLLWRKKLWAYPLTIVALVLFIVYQLYHFRMKISVSIFGLTIFDILMIVLTIIEYKRVKTTIQGRNVEASVLPVIEKKPLWQKRIK